MDSQISHIDTSLIVPGNNDRTVFNPQAIQELADSISDHGLIQPVTVRQIPDSEIFQIIAGERRFRACQLLKLETVKCIVLDASDEEASALMLTENTARQDLDPIDEALAYQSRMDAFGWSVAEVAKKAGVSAIRVNFRIKLLALRPEIQSFCRSGQFPIGYAQILSGAKLDPNFQQLALSKYRDNPKPTPGWFRREVGQLLEKQAQGQLFDLPLLGGPVIETAREEQAQEPAHPTTTIPPKGGADAREVLSKQATFWTDAATAWDKLGKPFKRQECEAAALALKSALAFV